MYVFQIMCVQDFCSPALERETGCWQLPHRRLFKPFLVSPLPAKSWKIVPSNHSVFIEFVFLVVYIFRNPLMDHGTECVFVLTYVFGN